MLTYFRTSSSLERLKSFRILDALFGPLILGFSVSVNPGRSFSPFFTITKLRTERSWLTMHPRTDFLLRSPLRLPYPRKHGVPAQVNIKHDKLHRPNLHNNVNLRVLLSVCRLEQSQFTHPYEAKDEHGQGSELPASWETLACHNLP